MSITNTFININCVSLWSSLSNMQGSPKGVGVPPPTPPGEGRQNLQKWLKQGFFQNFFANLIQNGLNDTKMEFFSM